MKKINVDEIYAMNLQEIKPIIGGSESRIYVNDDKVFKIYKDRNSLGEKLTYGIAHKKKLELLSTLKDLSEAILPEAMLVSQGAFMDICRGYSMNRVKNFISLYDLCEDSYRDDEIYKAIINASKAMETIHNRPENIVIGDANFSNVFMLPDNNGKYVIPRFSDFDSVLIKGINQKEVNVPKKLIDFYSLRRKNIEKRDVNENIDRLCYLLQFLQVLFGFNVYDINMTDYNNLSEEMKSLKEIKKIILKLRDLDKKVPYIPYLHEISMDEEETFLRRYTIMYD